MLNYHSLYFLQTEKRKAQQTMHRLVSNLNLLSVSFPTQLLYDIRHNIIACMNCLVFLRHDMHVYMHVTSFAICCIDYIILTSVFHLFPLSDAGKCGSTRQEKTCHSKVSRKLCSYVCVKSTLAVISSCALQAEKATSQEKVWVKMLFAHCI